jgi:organic radical activating enzyme
MRTYSVKDVFLTVQGEGFHAGTRAVFLRFAGCNAWSGRDEDRQRDTAKACCAAWCDTDFLGGEKMDSTEVADRVRQAWNHPSVGCVVITGGEPSLQLDQDLVDALHERQMRVHVETNGSRELPSRVEWITLSPKPPLPVVLHWAHEVKVVVPAVDPLPYERYAQPGKRFVAPLDSAGPGRRHLEGAGLVPRYEPAYAAAVDFVMANPTWRISIQEHKLLGVP